MTQSYHMSLCSQNRWSNSPHHNCTQLRRHAGRNNSLVCSWHEVRQSVFHRSQMSPQHQQSGVMQWKCGEIWLDKFKDNDKYVTKYYVIIASIYSENEPAYYLLLPLLDNQVGAIEMSICWLNLHYVWLESYFKCWLFTEDVWYVVHKQELGRNVHKLKTDTSLFSGPEKCSSTQQVCIRLGMSLKDSSI